MLSTFVRQSLDVLRMPIQQINEYIASQMEENPMFDLVVSEDNEDMFSVLPIKDEADSDTDLFQWEDGTPIKKLNARNIKPDGLDSYEPYSLHQGELLSDILCEQLVLLKLPRRKHEICVYIIACLNERGYLDFGFDELADELGESVDDIAEALYTIQSLQPVGVGARTLEECLILQLMHINRLNGSTLTLVNSGLDMLAGGDVKGIAGLIGCTIDEACDYAELIRGLNPLPSQGFASGNPTGLIIPDAAIVNEDGGMRIVINNSALPNMVLSREYCELMRGDVDEETRQYLRERYNAANNLIQSVEDRAVTLHGIILCIVSIQPEFFAHNGELRYMTMADVAEKLELNVSTVSRAVQGKYIICAAGTMELKSLFKAGIRNADGEAVSGDVVGKRLQAFIETEDKNKPLSDDALRLALQSVGINISRRTVAKYREQMGVPNSSTRRESYVLQQH